MKVYDQNGAVQESLTLSDIFEALKIVARAIANPTYVNKTTGKIQVTFPSPDVGTVTTVTSVTAIADVTKVNGDPYLAKCVRNASWGACVRGSWS